MACKGIREHGDWGFHLENNGGSLLQPPSDIDQMEVVVFF